eukprot:TRINITY_DN13575_c0_g1_i1.p1 TRINITY_DN13575_c0_g1~~TRINITY_DN13575_c0_g1_i1.p1  ORF type:complete len:388 (+),score=32.19 TRINITY_DN13575_c0_g1_i1:3-1166(+)
MPRAGDTRDVRLTIWQSFLSGGIAGVATRSFTSPLDVVKILAQVGTPESHKGFRSTFKQLYEREGLRAFWKGNLTACVRLFTYNAIQFTAFDRLRNNLIDPTTGRLSHINAWIGGAVAGLTATVITYPTDVVKTRLTVNANYYRPGYIAALHNTSMPIHIAAPPPPASAIPISPHPSTAPAIKYLGMANCFKLIVVEEGIAALYKGLVPSLLGVVPFAGGTFMAYEFLGRAWGKPRDQMTVFQDFVNGCLAASFGQTFSFPFDTIRKKMQVESQFLPDHMRPDVKSETMIQCFRKTIKKNGFLGLWRGTVANLLKVAPYAGILFASFEACKRVNVYYNGYTTSPLHDIPRPGVPQYLTPAQLAKWFELQKRRQANRLKRQAAISSNT